MIKWLILPAVIVYILIAKLCYIFLANAQDNIIEDGFEVYFSLFWPITIPMMLIVAFGLWIWNLPDYILGYIKKRKSNDL